MHPAKQLLQLQTLDLERDAQYRRLKQVIASLAEPETLRIAAAEVTAAQAVVTRAHARKQDLELEAQTLDAKIASVDERLYSGRVKNPKELSDLQNEVASLRRRRATLDDTLLEAMLLEEISFIISGEKASKDTFELAKKLGELTGNLAELKM
jgi:predicted  nucleic acid-binding Zn-ribbon protein